MHDIELRCVRPQNRHTLTLESNVHTLTLATPIGPGGGSTGDYEALINKPSINDVVLSGNKTWEDFGLPDLSYLVDMALTPLTTRELDAIVGE